MKERYETALQMRRDGKTFKSIGEALGVGTSRAGAIFRRAVVIEIEESAGLRLHAIGILRRCAQPLPELVRAAQADPDAALAILREVPRCNLRHAQEILTWLRAGNCELP